MPEGLALEFSGVTKRFGAITAVSDLTARVEPGQVTGFLGPNGAGKTTSLRILLGLVQATAGTATIGGLPYAKLDRPLQTVGAVLEASSFHPGRTAANHLAVYADAARIPRSRVDEVLGLVGLGDAAGRKVGGFSLGMRQRLGLAYALLGDPGILVLDEPANGLDPEGIKWMRGFLRTLAREGRTVLTSSHLLAEVQQTVDSLLVISQGHLVFQGGLDELVDPSEYATVVDGPDRAALVAALNDAGVSFEILRSGLTVRGLEAVQVGEIAAAAGITLSALHRRGPALEEVFLDLVNGTRVHPGSSGAVAASGAAGAASAAVAAGAAEAGHPDLADEVAEEQTDAAPAEAADDDAVPSVAPEPPVGAAAFAVASTGVIDVVPREETEDQAAEAIDAGEAGAETAVEAETPADGGMHGDHVAEAPEALAESEPATEPSGESDAAAAPEEAVMAPPAYGEPADVEDSDSFEPVDDEPAKSPEPVEAEPVEEPVAEEPIEDEPIEDEPIEDEPIDDEPVEDEAVEDDPVEDEPGESDRPWEEYVRTDSDVEADAFFASFDAEQAAAAAAAERARSEEREPAASDSEPPQEPEGDSSVVPEGERESEPEPLSDPEPEPERRPDPEPALSPEDPSPDTSEFGALEDLSPDWVEEEQGSRSDEGEQR